MAEKAAGRRGRSRVIRELPVTDVYPSIELVANSWQMSHFAHAQALVEGDGGLVWQRDPAHQLWVNPDCGLETRGYAETTAGLEHLIAATKAVR